MEDRAWWLDFRRENQEFMRKCLKGFQFTGYEWYKEEYERIKELDDFCKGQT